MSRMAFLTRVFAFSHVAPPSLSSAAADPPVYFWTRSSARARRTTCLAGVAEFHELLLVLARAEADLLEADEPADAVVDVDDQIANLQVPEVGEECAVRRSAAFVRPAFLFEEIALGENAQVGVGQMESAREMAGCDEHGGVFQVVVSATDRARIS
jgi:hypothetical protein